MLCSTCNKPVAESAKFCPQCGTPASSRPSSLTDPASDTPTARMIVDQTKVDVDPLVGRLLDSKYKLAAKLGDGGMGAVYRAHRTHIGDEVAVKVLHQQFVTDTGAIERFRREARAAAVLRHPNIVTIYDYGEPASGSPAFIVMELISGESLGQIIEREKRLEPSRAVSVMREICDGVAAAHRGHIVHRDLKPDNVIVLVAGTDRQRETVKVVDFGIAKLRDAASEARLTQTGTVIGTPFYMSPEQCRGEDLDARSDVYSLSAMMYEMLVGEPPFTAPSITGVIAKHLTQTPPPFPPSLKVASELESVVMRGLFKDPAMRYADAAELGLALQVAVDSAAQPINNTIVERAIPPQNAATTGASLGGNRTSSATVAHTVANPPHRSSWNIVFVCGTVFVALIAGGIGVYTLFQKRTDSAALVAQANEPRADTSAKPASSATVSPNPASPAGALPGANRGLPAGVSPLIPHAGSSNSDAAADNPITLAENKVVRGAFLTASDLNDLKEFNLRALRNACYARHGRIFDTPVLQRYFESRPWYSPRQDYNDSMLTAADKANIALIQSVEGSKK